MDDRPERGTSTVAGASGGAGATAAAPPETPRAPDLARAVPDVIDRASASILAVMDGLQLQWLLDPTAVDLGEASAFAIRAIVNAVLEPGPELDSYIEG